MMHFPCDEVCVTREKDWRQFFCEVVQDVHCTVNALEAEQILSNHIENKNLCPYDECVGLVFAP
jgi:hypothetical protein